MERNGKWNLAMVPRVYIYMYMHTRHAGAYLKRAAPPPLPPLEIIERIDGERGPRASQMENVFSENIWRVLVRSLLLG